MDKFALALPGFSVSSLILGLSGGLGRFLLELGIGDIPFTYKTGALIHSTAILFIWLTIPTVLFVCFLFHAPVRSTLACGRKSQNPLARHQSR